MFYLIFAMCLIGLFSEKKTTTHICLHGTALSEAFRSILKHSSPGCISQNSGCVLHLSVCSIFIAIPAAEINLCRGIRIKGTTNKQTVCSSSEASIMDTHAYSNPTDMQTYKAFLLRTVSPKLLSAKYILTMFFLTCKYVLAETKESYS